MTRRQLLGLGVGAAHGPPGRSASTRRPNVLMLVADDLNTWTGLQHEASRALTPSLNALARRGTVFRNAYCASPLCNPSRTAVLTGLAPWTSGIYENGHWWRPALPGVVTMPEFWRRNGYHAAGAGKVFHHTPGFNPPQVWDEFQTFRWDDPWDRPAATYIDVPPTPKPPGAPYNGMAPPRHEFDWGALPKAEAEYGDARSVAFAERFLAQPRTEPFFLAVGLFRPHLPWFTPKEYREAISGDRFLPEMVDGDLNDVPAAGKRFAATGAADFQRTRGMDQWPEAIRAYRASIRFADALYGRVLRALERSGQADNTVIVFWSDNGFHMGEKERFHKSTLWERACRVPLLIAAPGQKAATVDAPVSLLDVYPTLAALCGLRPPSGLDGRDLAPVLRSPRRATTQAVVTGFQPGNFAVNDGRWRYIRYQDGGEELYDLRSDPNEWTNLAGQPAMRAHMDRLARSIPAREAKPAPLKSAYRFDPVRYTWQPVAMTDSARPTQRN
ncbi:MAG: sulfatase [Acidobacteria bacterium]|nr:sulfatase [Acidobacteriota bacterium]